MHLIAIAMARQEMSLKKEELNFLPRFKNKYSEAPALISSLLLSNFLYRIFLGNCWCWDVPLPAAIPASHCAVVRIRAGDAGSMGTDVPIEAFAGEVNSNKAAWKFPTEAISRWEIGLLMIVNFFCIIRHRKIRLCFGTILR